MNFFVIFTPKKVSPEERRATLRTLGWGMLVGGLLFALAVYLA